MLNNTQPDIENEYLPTEADRKSADIKPVASGASLVLEDKPETKAPSPSRTETPKSPLVGMPSRPSFVYAVQKQPMDLSKSFSKLHFSQDGLNMKSNELYLTELRIETGLTAHPKYWTAAEVVDWLESNDLLGVVDYFEANNITGEQLIGRYIPLFPHFNDSHVQLWI